MALDRSEPAKKGKYTFLERSYEESDDEGGDGGVKKEEDDEDASQVESKLPRQTQRLVELIFNQNHFNAVLESIGYNANKLPLGKLSKATLKQGFDHLNELASLIKHPALAQNKHGVDQREVSLSFSLVRAFFVGVFLNLLLLDVLSDSSAMGVDEQNLTIRRPLRISPTNTTQRFPTNLAAVDHH